MIPMSAADRRPNDEPYYINKHCEDCGEKLVLHDHLIKIGWFPSKIWHDEFACPKCRNGIYMDWPESHVNYIKGVEDE